jgi:cystathionine gamma-synthase
VHIETLAVHAGHHVDGATGAVAPPIHLSTTFERAADGSLPHGFLYARDDNPTRAALEEALAALEGGSAALAFASGSAATLALLQTLRPGDHVVAPSDAYYGTARLLREALGPWGLEASFVDMRDVDAVRAALRPATRLVWVETPSNPLIGVSDVAAIAEVAHVAGVRVAVDNTWATPVLTRPLALGADVVMHSTTKYLGGHGDVTGGALVTRDDDEAFARARTLQKIGGAVPSPFDCWLVLRGLRTLPLRMRAHSEHALRVARALRRHPAVHAVHYPGLDDDPGHAVAARQMAADGEARYGGMLSVRLRGGRDAALGTAARLRLFTRATSLGGPESLVEHRATVEGAHTRTPDDLLRVSVGLEHPDDLIADFEQALDGNTFVAA